MRSSEGAECAEGLTIRPRPAVLLQHQKAKHFRSVTSASPRVSSSADVVDLVLQVPTLPEEAQYCRWSLGAHRPGPQAWNRQVRVMILETYELVGGERGR